MSPRQRGVVLTDRGKDRLENAIATAQDNEKYGKRFTQAELSERADLSIKTIKKIRDRKSPTDENSLRALFAAFDLELEPADFGHTDLNSLATETYTASRRQTTNLKIDWGEKPDTAIFFGRTEELVTLSRWVIAEQCRVVTLLGMGGIGKTSLAAKLADQIYDQFDYVIWRSLREAPPLDEILVRLIQFLSDQQETEINLPNRLGERIIRLLHYLREHRCLLVLDNLESILQSESAGHYREGYEVYGELIQHIGSTEHQSCLLLTSRECPRELAPMAGDRVPVRLWPVNGIDTEAGREILKTKGLSSDDTDTQSQELIRRYSGNPQALHLVATAIQREFLGDVDDFLQEEGAAVEDVRSLLDQHLRRLAPLERSILFWLAINREPVGPDELMEDLLPPVTKREVRWALRGLSDRYLIETAGKQFTLQNVIMEFVTDRLVEQVSEELQTQQFALFNTHALIKATAKDYVRETQVRLILKPIANSILDLQDKVNQSLKTIRQNPDWLHGYPAGNLLNMLCQMWSKLTDVDFSRVSLRQVYLQGMQLRCLNLENSYLINPSLTRSFGGVQVIAYSPNGRLMAAGDSKGHIQVWQVSGQKHIGTLVGHTNRIWSVAFSPDSKLLASGSIDCTARLWNLQELECIHVFSEDMNRVYSVAFSPDGTVLASSSNSIIKLWDLKEYRCIGCFSGHTSWVYSIAFSPNGQFLASGSSDFTVRLWDLDLHKLKCIHVFSGHTDWVESVAFSPNGQFLASGSSDFTVRLWDLHKLECIHVFLEHKNSVESIVFNHDGSLLASASGDFMVRLWDFKTRECLHVFGGHNDWVYSVAFDPSGQLLASSSVDGTVRLWDLNIYQCLYTFSGYNNRIWSVDFSPDGRLVASGSDDSIVNLWDLKQNCHFQFLGHSACVYSVAFSPDGLFLASGSDDTTVRLWDLQKHECLHVFSGHSDTVRSVTFSPDGLFLASGGDDNTMRLWNIQKGRCLHIFSGHTNWVYSVAFSPEHHIIATGSVDGTVRLWDLQEFQCFHVFADHVNWVREIAFSKDGDFLVSCSDDSTIRLYSLQERQCIRVFLGHTNGVWSIAFCTNGQTIATSSVDGLIRLWNVETGNCLKVLQVPRPYEGTNITGLQGLTEAQQTSMLALGAVNYSFETSASK